MYFRRYVRVHPTHSNGVGKPGRPLMTDRDLSIRGTDNPSLITLRGTDKQSFDALDEVDMIR